MTSRETSGRAALSQEEKGEMRPAELRLRPPVQMPTRPEPSFLTDALHDATVAHDWRDYALKLEAEVEWRPIKTAPKDGTRIDLWAQGKRWADAYFAKADDIFDWNRWEVQHDPSRCSTCSLPTNPNHYDAPTHWRPLPEPPRAALTSPDEEG